MRDVVVRPEQSSVPSSDGAGSLAAIRLRAADRCEHRGQVLYVHGATFPADLSVAYPFEGGSWMDRLSRDGFDAWAFDFLGFGRSSRYGAMAESRTGDSPLGRAAAAARQVGDVVGHIRAVTGAQRVSIVAHSWGTIAACLYACESPASVDRLALFGPIVTRQGAARPLDPPAYRDIPLAYQSDRFRAEVPAGEDPVLPAPTWNAWAEAYLDTDDRSRTRSPAAVRVPAGPLVDIADAWAGHPP